MTNVYSHDIILVLFQWIIKQDYKKKKQEAHGPWLAHLRDIATADMQISCNIFANPIIATNEKSII